MATLKNTTIDDSGFLRMPVGSTGQRPSPTPGMTRFNNTINNLEYYNGTEWVSPEILKDGSSSTRAALSAEAIKQANPNATDGAYWINLPTDGPTLTYCIMDGAENQGGWMLALKARWDGTNNDSTFNWGANYWTDSNTTLNTTDYNRNNSNAKFNVFNRFAAKDLLAIWPDLSANSGCYNSSKGHIWLQNNFYSGNRITLTNFFNTVDRYFISDTNNFCGINQFSRQTDVRFYGFNYRNNPGWARTRWGFGWNENGGGVYPGGNMDSDDVSGGIGMTNSFGNFSAGDKINCCQNVTGFNRQARVEVYVR